jgi:hypothetical protein
MNAGLPIGQAYAVRAGWNGGSVFVSPWQKVLELELVEHCPGRGEKWSPEVCCYYEEVCYDSFYALFGSLGVGEYVVLEVQDGI